MVNVKMELHRMFRVPRTGGLETKLVICPDSMQFGVKEEAAEVFRKELGSYIKQSY